VCIYSVLHRPGCSKATCNKPIENSKCHVLLCVKSYYRREGNGAMGRMHRGAPATALAEIPLAQTLNVTIRKTTSFSRVPGSAHAMKRQNAIKLKAVDPVLTDRFRSWEMETRCSSEATEGRLEESRPCATLPAPLLLGRCCLHASRLRYGRKPAF